MSLCHFLRLVTFCIYFYFFAGDNIAIGCVEKNIDNADMYVPASNCYAPTESCVPAPTVGTEAHMIDVDGTGK